MTRATRLRVYHPGVRSVLGVLAGVALVATATSQIEGQRPSRPSKATPTPTAPLTTTPPPPEGASEARSPRNANYSIDVDLDPRPARSPAARSSRGATSRDADIGAAVPSRTGMPGATRSRLMREWLRDRAEAPPDAGSTAGRSRTGLDRRHGDPPARRRRRADDRSDDRRRTTSRPDDGNVDDRTVLAVALPTCGRAGRHDRGGDSLDRPCAAHVRAHGRGRQLLLHLRSGSRSWACSKTAAGTRHQFHATTEFFSDYGVYDVRMTVPRGWLVGATGAERSRTDTPAGKTIHQLRPGGRARLRLDDEPGLRRARPRSSSIRGCPPVEMRLLLQPEHADQAERHFVAMRATLRYYGEWFGAVPVRPHHDRRSGVAERGRRHGIPDALHRRHALARTATT